MSVYLTKDMQKYLKTFVVQVNFLMRIGFRNLVAKENAIKVIWMRSGIYNKEAEKKAKENGIEITYNRCMKVEHSMLID
jgi:predicted CoA-binding protein